MPPTMLLPHLSVEELRERYRSCADPHQALRWHVLLLRAEGYSSDEAAAICYVSPRTVRGWVTLYNQHGASTVFDQRAGHSGRPRFLSDAHLALLQTALQGEPPGGGLWTGPKVAAWMRTLLERDDVHESTGWLYLKRIRWSLQSPRPSNPDADPVAQEEFKKKRWKKPSRRLPKRILTKK